ncbi:lysophospholipid transporter LplT [Paenibacillus doosanensis]|uniref:Lysophospholipid transporter LplT n=1 Tax=Paenibacillus konkukensis TaxID=2020716 RepID=A0ABY4RW23_9BACL|nr:MULTISPECIES: lysophospholipid transporter LplT [Paenibacillus]MCS7464347.1 lysophospholipid transporter LplT [Paenibacillus doosanensis]UQZ85886.1 Lysophospholipid transporter LplT [Paenibacillus konkukensis]
MQTHAAVKPARAPLSTNLKALNALYVTQFLSAFADNMSLLVIAGLLTRGGFSAESLALVTMAFFLPYIILAPFVGPFADKYPKSRVLIAGNAVKLLGIVLLLLIDTSGIVWLMLCYFTVGVGAVIYSPAKYGILPELTGTNEELFKANSRIEAYTILAILTGIGGGGAVVAAVPPVYASLVCAALYAISLAMTLRIPRIPGDASIRYAKEALLFYRSAGRLFRHPVTAFSLVGTGAFWMSSAVLRTAVLAWIPAALGYKEGDVRVSLLLATTSIGIIIGAFLAPRLVTLTHFYRSVRFGFIMAVLVLLFPWIHHTGVAIAFLLAVGCMGGVFIVPMNTVLQEEGLRIAGAGKTIAVQNLTENTLMLVGSALYYAAVNYGASISGAIVLQGGLLLLFLVYLGLRIGKVKPEVRQQN